MKTISLIIILASVAFFSNAQNSKLEEIKKFQKELNEHYADTAHSPLTKDDLAKFKSLEFFSPNLKLTLYQNLKLIMQKKYKEHLFLPFNDLTNGKQT